MVTSQLVGYVRKASDGNTLRLSIDVGAFEKAEKFSTNDGREFVSLVMNPDKVIDIINGEREVTSLCQIVGE